MSADSDVANGTTALKERRERIYLDYFERQTDADGRYFYSGEFVTPKAGKHRYWKWTLLRSGNSMFNLCVEPLSGRSVTLSSVELYGDDSSGPTLFLLTMKENIGQSNYQSGDFSVDANCWSGFDEQFTRDQGANIVLQIVLKWTEATVSGPPIPVSPAHPCVLEHQYNKVMDGGDSAFELVTSDNKSFHVSVAIFEAKSEYFDRFFATEGWKEQSEGRMVLTWTSAVVKQLIRYVYLNDVDGDVCQFLPDILDAAQMWELIGMKALIGEQMKQRLHRAARDADTDTAAEYLKMAHLHSLAFLVPVCNGVLADNYDQFYDSAQYKQIEQNDTYRHLVKGIFHHKHK